MMPCASSFDTARMYAAGLHTTPYFPTQTDSRSTCSSALVLRCGVLSPSSLYLLHISLCMMDLTHHLLPHQDHLVR